MQIGKLNMKYTFVINILFDVRRTNNRPAPAASSHWCSSLILALAFSDVGAVIALFRQAFLNVCSDPYLRKTTQKNINSHVQASRQQAPDCVISQETELHSHRCENLKNKMIKLLAILSLLFLFLSLICG